MCILESFRKKKDALICIDSDGCAMDTMDIKHFRCFGPCMIQEWKLEPWKTMILKRWNDVNLYTMTRGINRFLGLAMVLEEVDRTKCPVDGIRQFSAWAQQADPLSEQSLAQEVKKNGIPVFQKALAWSQAVNWSISMLPKEELTPFWGVKKGVERAHMSADIAIVSSANAGAVEEEWKRCNMMGEVDICLTQQQGSKAFCIGKMLEKGYDKNRVLMIGDAPGDRWAAEQNGVYFYPILVRREADSWQRFTEEALLKLLAGAYGGEYEQRMIQEFEQNLSPESI